MVNLIQIQQKIAEAIKQSGLTQQEIANALGINQTQISCYIHGKKMPALDTLANLCAILDLDANEILCLTENNRKSFNVVNSFNNNTNSNIKVGK